MSTGHERKNVVIIGATSGLGRELAVQMHANGYTIGATGRRTERLQLLRESLGERIFTREMDVRQPDEAIDALHALADDMGGMDIIVINAGVSNYGGDPRWKTERKVVEVNVRGFVALANRAFHYFEEQGHGHIVGVSSVAGLFGFGLSAPYNASKAFISNYLIGYRQRANHSAADIFITDLQPGFVESEMTAGKARMFWMCPTPHAVRQMLQAIEKKRSHAYIPKRWRLVAWAIKLIPNWVLKRL